MKITDLKIKDNITPEDIAEAIEFVVNSCFVNGGYNPYYKSFAEKIAIMRFFLDGIEYEDGDSWFEMSENGDIKKLINMFYGDPKFKEQAKIMVVVNENATDIIEYRKQRLIHGADAIEYIADTINRFKKYINTLDLDTIFNNLSSASFADITQEDIEKSRVIVDKIANGELDKAFTDVVKHDIDKESQEIIDAKNSEIEALKEKLAGNSGKEVDG